MAWVAVGAVVAIGGSLYGANQSSKAAKKEKRALKAQGRAAQQGKYFAAKQMDIAAGQQQAVGQRSAAEEIKKAELLQSRALAVAGASGAGASDPTFNKILEDIATEGQLSAANQMYSGEEAARALRVGAKVARWEGDMAKEGYNVQGAAVNDALKATRVQTVLDIASTAASWASKTK